MDLEVGASRKDLFWTSGKHGRQRSRTFDRVGEIYELYFAHISCAVLLFSHMLDRIVFLL